MMEGVIEKRPCREGRLEARQQPAYRPQS